jgi:hypothetical protein
MEQHLRGVQARGDRSAAEIDQLAQKLRDEQEIMLSLDQEIARTSGYDLLSANHPLTRAALRVPGHTQARFANVRVVARDAQPGRYFVLLSIARWDGLRRAHELWTSAVSLGDGRDGGDAIGDALLAALATGQLKDAPSSNTDLSGHLNRALAQLLQRQAKEEARRFEENRALIETRRISLRETHTRKVQQIEQRISTLRASGKTNTIHLHQAQLRSQDRQLREKESELDMASVGSLTVEQLAACVVEVTG